MTPPPPTHRYILPTHHSPRKPSTSQPQGPPARTTPQPRPRSPVRPSSPSKQTHADEIDTPTSFQLPHPSTSTSTSARIETPQQFKRPPRFTLASQVSRASPSSKPNASRPRSSYNSQPYKNAAAAAAAAAAQEIETEPVKKRPRLSSHQEEKTPVFREPPYFSAFLASTSTSASLDVRTADTHQGPSQSTLKGHHPRFTLPSTPIHHQRATYAYGRASTEHESLLLPEQFSPRHKRGRERFIPGSWADKIRGSLLEIASEAGGGGGGDFVFGGVEMDGAGVGLVGETIVRCLAIAGDTPDTADRGAGQCRAGGVVLVGPPCDFRHDPRSHGDSYSIESLDALGGEPVRIRVKPPSWEVALDVEDGEKGLGGTGSDGGRDEDGDRGERGGGKWTISPAWIVLRAQ